MHKGLTQVPGVVQAKNRLCSANTTDIPFTPSKSQADRPSLSTLRCQIIQRLIYIFFCHLINGTRNSWATMLLFVCYKLGRIMCFSLWNVKAVLSLPIDASKLSSVPRRHLLIPDSLWQWRNLRCTYSVVGYGCGSSGVELDDEICLETRKQASQPLKFQPLRLSCI